VKRIFLTGASAGIGRATAQILLEKGHHVWGTSRDATRLPKLERLTPIQLDLSQPDSIAPIFQAAEAAARGFDVVINNAGSGHFGPAEFLSRQSVQDQFQTVLFAHVELCQLALAAMRARGHGRIVNVTSLASRLPVPFMSAYNAAKAAMASFTMSLQLELQDPAIRVIDLQPADICTGFNDSVAKHKDHLGEYATQAAQVWRTVEKNMRDAPKPELVARRILQLIEDANPSPRVTVGNPFQAAVAPFINRFLSQRLRIWGLKSYYRL
jgi:short-subunit dehydrogenase